MNIEVKLNVPEVPTILDLATAYYRGVFRQAELAEEAILEAELNVANAQRIAQSTRDKAARLRAQADALAVQIDKAIHIDIAIKA